MLQCGVEGYTPRLKDINATGEECLSASVHSQNKDLQKQCAITEWCLGGSLREQPRGKKSLPIMEFVNQWSTEGTM